MISTWQRAGAMALAVVVSTGAARDVVAQTPAIGPAITGEYDSQFAGGQVNLRLEFLRGYVVGYYTSNASMPGSLAGQLRGNVLTGRWTDAGSTGGFVITFTSGARSFSGTWGRSIGSTTDGGPWVGRRKQERGH
ncbi:MAG: hypothetical protein R3A52_17355 [Polyangiales bacterium]